MSAWDEAKSDRFMGTEFLSYKGGTMTVVGVLPKVKGKTKKYLLTCSLCSQDKELFPEPFQSCISHLNFGTRSCGCSKTYNWSKEQYIIKIKRVCSEKRLRFNGFVSIFKTAAPAKLDLECLSCYKSWKTTSISSLLSGSGCPDCGRKIRDLGTRKPDKEYIETFMAAGPYREDDLFVRDELDKRFWNFHCSVCKEDEYAKAGLCSGVFKVNVATLDKGGFPCRCSVPYYWTRPQREYQVEKICKEEGLTIKGYDVPDNSTLVSTSKVLYTCKEGHPASTMISSFVNQGVRCYTCSRTSGSGNGYYEARKDEDDFLYVIPFQDKVKVGRSFDVKRRCTDIKYCAKLRVSPKPEEVYTSTHEVIYEIEQKILRVLRKA